MIYLIPNAKYAFYSLLLLIYYYYYYYYYHYYYYSMFPPNGGTMALPHPLLLKFMLFYNTDCTTDALPHP